MTRNWVRSWEGLGGEVVSQVLRGDVGKCVENGEHVERGDCVGCIQFGKAGLGGARAANSTRVLVP